MRLHLKGKLEKTESTSDLLRTEHFFCSVWYGFQSHALEIKGANPALRGGLGRENLLPAFPFYIKSGEGKGRELSQYLSVLVTLQRLSQSEMKG